MESTIWLSRDGSLSASLIDKDFVVVYGISYFRVEGEFIDEIYGAVEKVFKVTKHAGVAQQAHLCPLIEGDEDIYIAIVVGFSTCEGTE